MPDGTQASGGVYKGENMERKYVGIKEFASYIFSSTDPVRALVCRPEFAPYRKDGMFTKVLLCKESIELMKSFLNRGWAKNCTTDVIIKERPRKKRYNTGYYPSVNGWTKSAIDCYNIGCTCSKCNVYKMIDFECCMKMVVFECVRRFGKPNKTQEENINESR